MAAADDPERLFAGAGAGSGGLPAGEACSRMRPTGRAVVDAPLVVAVLAGVRSSYSGMPATRRIPAILSFKSGSRSIGFLTNLETLESGAIISDFFMASRA